MRPPNFTDPNQNSLFDVANKDRSEANAPRFGKLFAGKPEPPTATPAERREDGMTRAEEHANKEEPNWSERARIYIEFQIKHREEPFLAEELVSKAEKEGFPPPPDKRAWGAVFRRLAVAGKILKVGYAPAKTSNLSPKVLWRRSPPEFQE